MKKKTYLKPEVEALLLQYESPLAQSGGSGGEKTLLNDMYLDTENTAKEDDYSY